MTVTAIEPTGRCTDRCREVACVSGSQDGVVQARALAWGNRKKLRKDETGGEKGLVLATVALKDDHRTHRKMVPNYRREVGCVKWK